jgi:uncharacterized protein (TIGR02246 family)
MKRISAVAVIFLCAISAQAGGEEAAIRKMLDGWKVAFEAKDLAKVMTYYAPGDRVVAFDIVPPLEIVGRENYRKNYQMFFDMYDGPIQFEFRDLRIVAEGHVAFIYAVERITGVMKGGQKTDSWMRATSGLRKIDGKWLIVHDHISVPVDYETGKALLDLKP